MSSGLGVILTRNSKSVAHNTITMSKTITYQKKKIHYSDVGKGDAIVLLHGFLESLEMWDEFSKELKKDFRVICIDLPGFGASEMIAEIHSMEMFADCVKAVLDHLGISDCVMIGHSMGGYVSLEFAEKHPLKGLGIFHSHASGDDPEKKKNRNRAISVIKQNHVGFIKEFIPDLFANENVKKFSKEIKILKERAGRISKEAILAAMVGMRDRESKLEVLSKIDVPVLFIAGKQDIHIPLAKVMENSTIPKHSEILVLGNIAHMGFLEAKDECLRKIRYFADYCFTL